jgi:hypothetical protein
MSHKLESGGHPCASENVTEVARHSDLSDQDNAFTGSLDFLYERPKGLKASLYSKSVFRPGGAWIDDVATRDNPAEVQLNHPHSVLIMDPLKASGAQVLLCSL